MVEVLSVLMHTFVHDDATDVCYFSVTPLLPPALSIHLLFVANVEFLKLSEVLASLESCLVYIRVCPITSRESSSHDSHPPLVSIMKTGTMQSRLNVSIFSRLLG